MKDALITVRLPRATRHRIEALARREGRSLSQQVERLILGGLDARAPGPVGSGARPRATLAGALRGTPVPALADFRAVRQTLSRSLRARAPARDGRR